MDQGVTSTLKSYHLRSIFCKAIDAIDSHSSHGSGQSQLKTSWTGTALHATEKSFMKGRGN